MILVFGAVLMKIQLGLDKTPAAAGTHFAPNYDIDIGGKAAIQSLAAVKSGTKAALISQTGDDHYGKNILLRLRQSGVITSGVARHEHIPTGTAINIGRKNSQQIIALSASAKANHEQAPEEILKADTVLLLQDEFPAEQQEMLISKAKAKNATVILNCGIRQDFHEYDKKNLDYIITNENNHKDIEYITKTYPEKLIILNTKGAYTTFTNTGQPVKNKAPYINEDIQWADPTCAEDAFCGALAAGILKQHPLEETLHRAAVTRILTASKPGGYTSLPYPDEITEAVEATLG